MQQLTTFLDVRQYAVVISFSGEIDLAVSEKFDSDLNQALAAAEGMVPAPPVIIDLQGVTFFASCGFSDLLKTRTEANYRGLAVVLITSRRVQRLMERTHLDEIFDLHLTLEDALRAVGVAS
ncbi:STAS domain-containing protein [Candidatus Mycobacterium wuenschmannii]|uniref:Anti-sigma factor antagonist n=1 Tax=Candidatus Mycobacterium wuenschmannii TaxID=3027808 RepID=A0ABY8W2J2_9MYCO|nr:STAS domain-containing protein [Candidatus Mycobacterium wuenschmannii]WIM87999.1 STAS domain-containing protein [Candidatus Mycobacterium wuenschmannii]